METCIDRSEVSKALAKAIAYKNCGQDEKAQNWACRLVHLLECSCILADSDDRINEPDSQ